MQGFWTGYNKYLYSYEVNYEHLVAQSIYFNKM
jgi:hypothetical protein